MWNLFSKPLTIEPESLSLIIDDDGTQCYVDTDYRDLGVREGWLRRTGYMYDYRGRFTFTYKHITRPKNPKLP